MKHVRDAVEVSVFFGKIVGLVLLVTLVGAGLLRVLCGPNPNGIQVSAVAIPLGLLIWGAIIKLHK